MKMKMRMYIQICFLLMIWASHTQAGSAPLQSNLVIDSVSIVPGTQHVIIGWTLQTPVQEGYIEIHRKYDGALYNSLVQLPLSQSGFIDTGVNASLRPVSYYVVARHLNGDNIVVSEEAHITAFLHTPRFSVCERQVTLSWNNYGVTTSSGISLPMPIPFDTAIVFMSHNNQEYREVSRHAITEAPGEIINVSEEGTYGFKIRYINSTTLLTATSNRVSVNVSFAFQPSFLNVRRVSLDEASRYVAILLHGDTERQGLSYLISRLNNGEFTVIETLDAAGQNFVSFTDGTAQANSRAETYKIAVLDSCGVISLETHEIQTIFLQIASSQLSVNELHWNHYNGWPGGVEGYEVHRKIGDGEFEIVAYVPGSTNRYLDDLSMESEWVSQDISYRIKALHSPNDSYFFEDWVFSNIARRETDMKVFIPNAINLSSSVSQNRVFKPLFHLYTPQSYSLMIFNRWGQSVFSSNNPTEGWEGSYNGSQAPEGIYSYVIEFMDRDGASHKKMGVVLLMR